ncbi:hypothetical protein CHUAL_007714 [Chamberlinius hualienensis]|uniref:Cytochrome P450 3195A1 n=1 Tax=Chamberlinius hualienensis TaxID=1551368 RepID=A0A1J1DVQ7_9MYRI|nr:cytochrome P450 3195A1 [Chamberlinius hualienensis]
MAIHMGGRILWEWIIVAFRLVEKLLDTKLFKLLNIFVNRFSCNNTIPGPKEIPLLGHLHLFSPLGPYKMEKLQDAFFDLHRQFGPIVRLKLGVEMVVVFNPEDAKTVLHSDGRYPFRPPMKALLNYRKSNPQLYNRMGLFSDNGEDWLYMRKLTDSLVKANVAESYLQHQSEVADHFMDYVESHLNGENIMEDVLMHLYKYTQEAFGVVCFGGRLGCISESTLGSKVNSAVCMSLESIAKTMLGIPWWKFNIHTSSYKNLCQAQECLRSVTEKYLENASSINESERGVYLNFLLNNKELDRRDLTLLSLELFHAGIDATASIIAFCLYYISKDPKVQNKVLNEIDDVIGDGDITTESLMKVKYLRACLNETYRMNPTAAGTARILSKPMTLSNYTVNKGTFVLCCHPAMCRDEKYVDDPNVFCPERYLPDSPISKPPPFVSLPFSNGARMCPGKRFAQQEIILFLIKFFMKFGCSYEGEEVGSIMRLNMMPDKPINLKIIHR